ncbi:hypothetical protein [Mycolicibacterium houstonense]|uniref:hypothetical protein n=1 Tax=Mycolicibacterium houstonense TaxID=146021 RepID=UPI000A97E922|nr:hypothetical protein [Mycolicibacterium houstonense]
MQLAARSYLTAGVALVGAGAIAVSPLAPPAPDVQVPAIDASSAAVNLTAAANPLQLWADVIGATVENLGGLGEQFSADPAPILRQIIANQLHSANILATSTQKLAEGLALALDPNYFMSFPAALKQSFELIAAGDLQGGLSTLPTSILMLGLPLLDFVGNQWAPGAWSVIAQPFTNLANLVTKLPEGTPALLLNGLISPLAATAAASGYTLENLVSAATDGDAIGFVSALVNSPATITGALLNGFEIDNGDGMPPTVFTGLLNPQDGFLPGGAISTVLNTLSQIADSLATPGADRDNLFGTPPSLAGPAASAEVVAVSSTLAPTAKTVTLDVAQTVAQTKELTAPAAASEAAPAVDVDEASAESDDAGAAPATPTKVSTKVSVKSSPKAPAKVDSPAKAVRDQVKSAVSKVTGGLKKDKAGSEKAGADKAGTAKKADSSTGSAKDSD